MDPTDNEPPAERPAAGSGTDPEGDNRYIHRVAILAFLLNLGLAGMKGALALTSGSLAVAASAIDSATDCIASMALFAGLKLSVRKTPSFPLGLYKIENVLSVVVALFIFLAGYEIAREAFKPAFAPPDISLGVVLLLALGTLATHLFGRYAVKAGRRTGSPTLKAEGRHRQVDVVSSSLVLASAVLGYAGVRGSIYGIGLDQAAAVLVLVFIAHSGWGLLSDGMRVLLDASIDSRTLMDVQKIIEEEPMVAEVTHLVGRNAGRFRFLQATVVLRTDDLQKAHQISDQIEKSVKKRVPRVEYITVHYEPIKRTLVRVAVPLADRSGILSDHLGESPLFALLLLRLADRRVLERETVENPCSRLEKGRGICVAEWLVEKNVDEVWLKGEMRHRGPGYVFSDAGVAVRESAGENLDQALQKTA